MVVTDKDDARGCMVYEITLGRTELEKASKDGLAIPRNKLRECDDVVIKIGPDLKKTTYEGLGKMVDESFNKRHQEKKRESE